MKRESLVSLMLLSLVAFLAPKTLLADQVVKPAEREGALNVVHLF